MQRHPLHTKGALGKQMWKMQTSSLESHKTREHIKALSYLGETLIEVFRPMYHQQHLTLKPFIFPTSGKADHFTLMSHWLSLVTLQFSIP